MQWVRGEGAGGHLRQPAQCPSLHLHRSPCLPCRSSRPTRPTCLPCRANLSTSVRGLPSLEELVVAGCTQVSILRLQAARLARLQLRGTRALTDLEMRCPRLEEVAIEPLNPGLPACHALK